MKCRKNRQFVCRNFGLAIQDFDEIAAKADNRFITVRSEQGEDGQAQASQIIPVDAIRHFETVSAEDRQAMKARYADTDPAKIDALKTRIVYFGVDPESVETGRPNFFQKMFPVDIRDDLSAAQNLDIVGIGHGRFLLASEITDARDLSEAELKSLARKYNLYSETDGDLTTSITLRSGDLILSSLAAEDMLGKPQGTPRPARRRSRRPTR